MTREEHLLCCLAEECNEVGQRVSKALRFGLNEIQAGQPLTNAQRIREELNDLIAVAAILEEDGAIPEIDAPTFPATIKAKLAKIEKYFSISREQGRLSP